MLNLNFTVCPHGNTTFPNCFDTTETHGINPFLTLKQRGKKKTHQQVSFSVLYQQLLRQQAKTMMKSAAICIVLSAFACLAEAGCSGTDFDYMAIVQQWPPTAAKAFGRESDDDFFTLHGWCFLVPLCFPLEWVLGSVRTALNTWK